MAKNTVKTNNFKKKPRESRGRSFRLNLKLLKDRRLHLAVGFFLLITSVYLFTALLSYLFTGKADQSVVESMGDAAMQTTGLEVTNWLGLFGALLSHYFIYKWFGIAAFLFPPLLFVFGYRIVFRRKLIHSGRAFTFVFFFSFWISVLFGIFTLDLQNPGAWSYLGGGIGYELSQLFYSLIGWGTFLLLILALLVFTVYFFNITTILGLSMPWGEVAPMEETGEAAEATEGIETGPTNKPRTNTESTKESSDTPATNVEEEEGEMTLVVKGEDENTQAQSARWTAATK